MADGRHDRRLFLVDPATRGVFPLEDVRVSKRLARTVPLGRFEIRPRYRLRGGDSRRARRPGRDGWKPGINPADPEAVRRAFRARPGAPASRPGETRGWSAASTDSPSAAPSLGKHGPDRARRQQDALIHLAARLARRRLSACSTPSSSPTTCQRAGSSGSFHGPSTGRGLSEALVSRPTSGDCRATRAAAALQANQPGIVDGMLERMQARGDGVHPALIDLLGRGRLPPGAPGGAES